MPQTAIFNLVSCPSAIILNAELNKWPGVGIKQFALMAQGSVEPTVDIGWNVPLEPGRRKMLLSILAHKLRTFVWALQQLLPRVNHHTHPFRKICNKQVHFDLVKSTVVAAEYTRSAHTGTGAEEKGQNR